MSLTLASQTIGFISFSITLLTLLGVYADLLGTLRNAASTIPITLGNLRSELQCERILLRHRLKVGDEYHVFPARWSRNRRGRRGPKTEAFERLMNETLRGMWNDFKAIEKPFVVKGRVIEDLEDLTGKQTGEDSEDDGLDEKGLGSNMVRTRSGRRKRRDSHLKSRMGMVDAGLSSDGRTYYNTDLPHRLLWWWKLNSINSLLTKMQRMQIRRIERDVYETDELVKRNLRLFGRMSGDDIWFSDDSSSDGGGGSRSDRGGGGGNGGKEVRRRSAYRNVAPKSMKTRSRPASSLGRGEREVYEKETIRVRERSPSISPPRTRIDQSDVGSRRQRSRGPDVEYEIVNPGRIWVEPQQPTNNYRRRSAVDDRRWAERPRSYSRERSPSRGRDDYR